MRAAQKAVELVEAALEWTHVRLRAEVPFANQTGRVAGRFETIGDGGFRERQALGAAGIELVSEPRLVAAREQARACRRAIRPRHVAAGEAHA